MKSFNPPHSGSIRLSKDVWALLCPYAELNGNRSPRDALEQLVRQTLGNAQPAEPSPQTTEVAIASKQPTVPDGDAAAALDSLI